MTNKSTSHHFATAIPSLTARLLFLLALLAIPTSSIEAALPPTTATLTADQLQFFESRVRPLLANRCYKCHATTSKKIKAGLTLDSKQGWSQGGDSGPAITPNSPATSLLIKAISYTDHDLKMPPKAKLPQSEINTLTKWIQMGAPDPRIKAPATKISRRKINIESGRDFWSFKPITSPSIPKVRDGEWPHTDIDRFVLAKLEANNLTPTSDTNKLALLRRATFDLLGLPPTEAQRAAFLSDNSPNAFAKLIDRLLESPHFGERWGRHWLDVARFAESTGGGRSLMFPNAWRYRDYVIQAYNNDTPFNQFIRQQIAGDLLPHTSNPQRQNQLTATAFLMLGPHNYEQQDKAFLRMDIIDEQIATTSKAFLGLTLDCARCHDHKFDPLTAKDYYAMAGIFGSTNMITPGNVSGWTTQPLDAPAIVTAYNQHTKTLADFTKERKKLITQRDKLTGATSTPAAIKLASLPGILSDNEYATFTGPFRFSTSTKPFVGPNYSTSPEANAAALFQIDLPKPGAYEVRLAYTASSNRTKNAAATINHTDGSTTIDFNQTKRPPIDNLFISLGTFTFNKQATINLHTTQNTGYLIVDAIQLLPLNNKIKTPLATNKKEQPQNSKAIAELNKQIATLDTQIKQLNKAAPPKPNRAMALIESDNIADEPLHIRGQAHNLGPIVPRGVIQVALPANATQPVMPTDQSGRLQLADWIASPNNPLTARVYVNRVWAHLIGQGLVTSLDNFGLTGDRPTHPKLLDHLTTQFIANNWSTKQLIRSITQSRTYQLALTTTPQNLQADPDNQLLTRAHRRRLEAEPLRDAILAISGQLDTTPGGLTIRKVEQYDLTYQFNTNRRSVYVPAFRASLLEIFEVFDAATPNTVIGQRNASTLPTQALFMMNSPFVINQAQAAAQRLVDETPQPTDHTQRIELAYLRTLNRQPSPAEQRQALRFITSASLDDGGSPSTSPTQAYAALFHALFASTDFRYLN